MRSSTDADAKAIIEKSFRLDDIASDFREDEPSEEGERRIVARTMMVIRLFRRSGNVEKVLRKPKLILEQDLVEYEGENEG